MIAGTNLKGVITKIPSRPKARDSLPLLKPPRPAQARATKDMKSSLISLSKAIFSGNFFFRPFRGPRRGNHLPGGFRRQLRGFIRSVRRRTVHKRRQAKFRASRAGWQFGGIIVLYDSEGQLWSIIIDRLSSIVRLQPARPRLPGQGVKMNCPSELNFRDPWPATRDSFLTSDERRATRHGFTLIESMAAVALLAFICGSIWLVLERCTASAADSIQRMRAFEIARDNMETLLGSTLLRKKPNSEQVKNSRISVADNRREFF